MPTTSAQAVRSSDFEVFKLEVRELTPESFAPYGEVSRPAAGLSMCFADIASVCHVRCTAQPFALAFLSRHAKSNQVYVPLGSSESIIVVAPPSGNHGYDALPDPHKLAAFRLDGSCAVNLHRGTWHRSPLPLSGSADFLVIDREGTLDDLELVDLGLELGVSIEVAR